MSAISRAGMVLASEIAGAYKTNPGVVAILVGGSVARGYADNYSDLELGIFWADSPTADERKDAISRAGGEIRTFERTLGHEFFGVSEVRKARRWIEGTALVSGHHLTVSRVEQILSDVVVGYDTSLEKQALVSTILHGVGLHGDDLLRKWRAKVSPYPHGLAIKMVQENLWFGPWFRPEAYAERGDLLVLYQHLIWVEQGLLKVLAGLNRIYYPSIEHKWSARLIAQMEFAPSNLSHRLKQIWRSADPEEAWGHLKGIVDETLSLVERNLPEVNRVSMFEAHPEVNVKWARQRWEPEAPYTLLERIAASLRV